MLKTILFAFLILFMPGEGVPTPADYEKTNHVSAEVVSDIAAWILKRG
ncbi:MAG: hypothetical protein M3033_07090 [Acidobacteriota bacterium]|nr:hypothetical protein [Acidobacteriota bacterium]